MAGRISSAFSRSTDADEISSPGPVTRAVFIDDLDVRAPTVVRVDAGWSGWSVKADCAKHLVWGKVINGIRSGS